MKIIYTFLIALFFLSCKQSGSEKSKITKDSLTNAKPAQIHKDTLPTYTSDIYNQYIPASLSKLIEVKLPGWKIPPPETWEKFWFNEYKKEGILVNYIFSDFNGDGKSDYALILKNNENEFAVWVLQSKQNDYVPIKLCDIDGVQQTPLNVGIELEHKGKLDYIDPDNENHEPVNLKYPAIGVDYFEKGGETYYWESNKYKSVTTGD